MAQSLPYPGMDFTPLDILTANELDQMVANIEFLANKMAADPVSVSLTDFMTMATGYELNTSYSSVYKWGKLLVARLQVNATNAFSTSNSIIGSINAAYKGNGIWNYATIFGGDNNVRDYGYCYVNFGSGTSNIYLTTSGQSSVTGLVKARFIMVYFLK